MNLRLLLSIILFAALQIPCCAQQEMSVAGFHLLENDLTANRQGTQEVDQNGHKAALIRVVTIEKGFTFESGYGIVKTVSKAGEIWVYVPQNSRRITIHHPTFGVLRSYEYPIPIESGRTYELLLDIGSGRYVTLNASRSDADIEVDGRHVGKAPVYNHYLSFGSHTVKAVSGRFEGTADVFVSANERKDSTRIVTVDMQDMSHLYGDVTVTVANNAEIWYAGRLVGTGEWRQQLKEGLYDVETRKADCDPMKTQFVITAQQRQTVTATPPTPHMGRLSIYTRPRNVTATDNGRPIDLMEVQTLPVGTHQIALERKGYVTLHQEYTIKRGETVFDTLQMTRITYVKPFAFYFGAAYSLRSLSGMTGFLGIVHRRHDLQLSYTFGLSKSNTLYTYDNSGQANAMHYTQNSLAVHYGYQFPVLTHFALTPQIGYSYDHLIGHLTSGSTLSGKGASAHCLTLGLKLQLVPIQHTTLFVQPEFAIPVSKSKYYTTISNLADFSAGGFGAHVGLLVNF